jgi:hypothetical protein
MISITEQKRRFTIVLDISEDEAIALRTVVDNVAKFGLCYQLCDALAELGVEPDMDLLANIPVDDDGDMYTEDYGIWFKERVPED